MQFYMNVYVHKWKWRSWKMMMEKMMEFRPGPKKLIIHHPIKPIFEPRWVADLKKMIWCQLTQTHFCNNLRVTPLSPWQLLSIPFLFESQYPVVFYLGVGPPKLSLSSLSRGRSPTINMVAFTVVQFLNGVFCGLPKPLSQSKSQWHILYCP